MITKFSVVTSLLALSLLLNMIILMRQTRHTLGRTKPCPQDGSRGLVRGDPEGPRENATEQFVRQVQRGRRIPLNSGSRMLVTGAAGFLGMHLSLRLVRTGELGGEVLSSDQIVAVDYIDAAYDLDLKISRSAELRRSGIDVLNGTLCDSAFLRELFEKNKFTHVIHLAESAGARARSSRSQSLATMRSAECFEALLECIVTYSPRAHLLYASSSNVYGLVKKTSCSEGDHVDNPLNLDGARKRSNELLAFAFFSDFGLHSTGLRIFNVYGEWESPAMAVFKFAHLIESRSPIELYYNGTTKRDMAYVGDIVDGIISACEYRAPPDGRDGVASTGVPHPEIFNLGSGQPVEDHSLIRALERSLNTSAVVVPGKPSAHSQETAEMHADTAKAMLLLGWSAQTPLEQGVEKFVAWYRSHGSAAYIVGAESHERDIALQNPGPVRPVESDPQLGLINAMQEPIFSPNITKWDVSLEARSTHEILKRRSRDVPVIAIVTASTSRKIRIDSLATHPLWAMLIQSTLTTVEHGYEYWIYVGFDAEDELFERADFRAKLENSFSQQAFRLWKNRQIDVQLQLLRLHNPLRKPGPVFNLVSAAAVADGADYVYRVNDDVRFQNPWARSMVAALAGFVPANLGVVGPTCDQGNQRILTFDFTHRTHAAVFGAHYPTELTDWWLDDWISSVYPPTNALRLPSVHVYHGMRSNGRRGPSTRYSVDWTRRGLLRAAVDRGRALLDAFLHSLLWEQCHALRGGGHSLVGLRDLADAAHSVRTANVTLGSAGSSVAHGRKRQRVRDKRRSRYDSTRKRVGSRDGKGHWSDRADGTSVADRDDGVMSGNKTHHRRNRKSSMAARRAAKAALALLSKATDNAGVVERVRSAARDSPYTHKWAIVMLVNSGILNMTLNWICNIGNRGLHRVLRATVFVALDSDAHSALAAAGRNAVLWSVAEKQWRSKQTFGSAGYFALIHMRQRLILDVLAHNVSVLVAEPDATWYADLVDFVEADPRYSAADAIAYDDSFRDDVVIPCGGLLFLRATPAGRALMSALNAQHKEGMRKSRAVLPEQQVLRLVWTSVPGAFEILPRERFTSGRWYRANATRAAPTSEGRGDEGLLFVHANYITGVDRKVERMRERGQWYLDDLNRCQPTPVL